MREYKFRGKNKITNEWVYGYYFCVVGKHTIIDESGIEIEVIKETVGQFTGLLDENKKEIYEGDAIISKCGNQLYWVVDWFKKKSAWGIRYPEGKDSFLFTLTLPEMKRSKWRKIGDIYENPEFLKDKQL